MPPESNATSKPLPGAALALSLLFCGIASVAIVGHQRPIKSGELAAGTVPSLPEIKIDPNRASVAELAVLRGIGPRLAERIVHDRDTRGPFPSLEALSRVPGIGPVTIERIEPHVHIRPKHELAPDDVSSHASRE